MIEMILDVRTLPEALFKLIRTKKVKVNETDGVINLIPIEESNADCVLLGLTSGSGLTVDRFLAMTHTDDC